MSISYEQLCKDPTGFVAAIAERVGIDPRTLRQGYSEPVTPSGEDDPALPSKSEVMKRYLASVRKLHGAGTARARAPEDLMPARPRVAAK
jgi:LPS sulfotransferase NodH